MPTNFIVGEFEQLVLLSILRLGEEGYAVDLRRRLNRTVGRRVSRGALYRTLDRLEGKGLVTWDLEEGAPERGGHPRRRFAVTRDGLRALATSRKTLLGLWSGLEEVLDEAI